MGGDEERRARWRRAALPDLDVAPRQEKEFSLALPALAAEPGAEYWLNLSFSADGRRALGEEGARSGVGAVEAAGRSRRPRRRLPRRSRPLRIVTRFAVSSGIGGRDFALVFDRLNGYLVNYSYKSAPLIDRGPLPDFWRAMTDNDFGAWKSVGNRRARTPRGHPGLARGRRIVEGHRRAGEPRGRLDRDDRRPGGAAAGGREVHGDLHGSRATGR